MMFNSNSMFPTWFFVLVVLFIIAAIVANDANKRGHNGLLWAFVVVFMPMMGLFFYLIFVSVNPTANTNNIINKPQSPPRYSNPQPQYTQAYQAPSQEVVTPQVSKYCVACGKGNIDTADFCNGCGTEIPRLGKANSQ